MNNQSKIFLQESFINLIYFTPMVFYAVYLNQHKGISFADAASILFVLSIVSRVGRVLLSDFTTHMPFNKTMTFFQFLGVIGYILFAIANHQALFYLAAILVGLFYGNCMILLRAFFYSLPSSEKTSMNFAKLAIFTNIGVALGPIFMNLVYTDNPAMAFYFLSLALCANAMFSWFSLKQIHIPKQYGIFSLRKNMFQIHFLGVFAIVSVIWFIYSFGFSIAPILIHQNIPNGNNYLWVVATLNGLLVVAFSIPIMKQIHKINYCAQWMIIISCSSIILGYILLHYHVNIISIIVFIILITSVEIIAMPMYHEINQAIAKPEQRIFALSVIAISTGIGESLGTFSGLNFIEKQAFLGEWFYPTIIGLNLFMIVFLFLIKRRIRMIMI